MLGVSDRPGGPPRGCFSRAGRRVEHPRVLLARILWSPLCVLRPACFCFALSFVFLVLKPSSIPAVFRPPFSVHIMYYHTNSQVPIHCFAKTDELSQRSKRGDARQIPSQTSSSWCDVCVRQRVRSIMPSWDSCSEEQQLVGAIFYDEHALPIAHFAPLAHRSSLPPPPPPSPLAPFPSAVASSGHARAENKYRRRRNFTNACYRVDGKTRTTRRSPTTTIGALPAHAGTNQQNNFCSTKRNKNKTEHKTEHLQ